MTLSLSDYVNELSQTSRLSNIGDYIRTEEEASPIDDFRNSFLAHLSTGGEETLLNNDVIGRLLCIGLVSAAENYFRAIIAGVLHICPVSQKCAADRTVALGAVTWHTGTRYNRSALEHASLAEASGLKSAFKNSLNIDLPNGSFNDPLKEYERVCQLRHGIVHNDGFMPGRNAVKLELPRMSQAARIIVRYEQLQEIGAVIYGLVRLVNRHVFYVLCERWALEWRRRADWCDDQEDLRFGHIWNLCLSKEELKLRTGRSRITRKLCAAQVKREFGII